MQHATSLSCEMFTVARQPIIKRWNEWGRQMRTKNSVGFGKGIVEKEGHEVGLETDLVGCRGTVQATVML